MTPHHAFKHRQRGWAGLLVLLLALVVVGFLAKDALLKYGLATSTAIPRTSAAPVVRDRDAVPADARSESSDVSRAPMPIERARAVDDVVKRGAEERAKSLP